MKTIISSVMGAGLALGLLLPTQSRAQTQQLPISAFLDVQVAGQQQFWSDPVNNALLGFDAFGQLNEALGLPTDISGGVTIRDLGNGTELVTVDLHTHDGICFGFINAVPAFGRTPAEIAAGAAPSLGDANVLIEFTQPVGAPLQTWNVIAFGGPPIVLTRVNSSISCQHGELRSASGFPDGTPGFARTTQVGVLSTGVPTGCPPEKFADCFPAEKIQFKPNGG